MDKQTHMKCIKFIFECSEKLRLKDLVVASACSLYHDFFKHTSPSDYCPHTVATTAIYHATKLEEQQTRIRDVVNVCHRALHPDKFLGLDEEYWKFRDSIASFELLMLRMLKFDTAYCHPHKYLLHYLHSISKLFPEDEWHNSAISNMCYGMLKDSFVSSSCMKHSPQKLSIAVIHLCLQCCDMNVPLVEHSKKKWWEVLYEKCTLEDILMIQDDLVSTYDAEVDKCKD